jgi:hypothetical protein
MKCYPLGIAALLAMACDCIRRGDIAGAQAALARAAALAGDTDDGASRGGGAALEPATNEAR